VDSSEIELQARLQEGRPEHGRVPRLPTGVIGRFGLKAQIPTVEEFVAGAFQSDMGLTSRQRPSEPPNPEGKTDDMVLGQDLSDDLVEDIGFYVTTLDILSRKAPTIQGERLFQAARCATCHVPAMKTSSTFWITQMAGKSAKIYSDMLLHDMGTTLADGIVEGVAREREWRTAPLIGLRHLDSFLHDGRALSFDQAIHGHGGPGSEANASIEAYDALTPPQKQQLEEFVLSL
jgi:CxxC motif-containing protein (DUF1111 family)